MVAQLGRNFLVPGYKLQKETFSSNGHSSDRAAIYDTPAASGDQVAFHTNYGNFKEEDENKY